MICGLLTMKATPTTPFCSRLTRAIKTTSAMTKFQNPYLDLTIRSMFQTRAVFNNGTRAFLGGVHGNFQLFSGMAATPLRTTKRLCAFTMLSPWRSSDHHHRHCIPWTTLTDAKPIIAQAICAGPPRKSSVPINANPPLGLTKALNEQQTLICLRMKNSERRKAYSYRSTGAPKPSMGVSTNQCPTMTLITPWLEQNGAWYTYLLPRRFRTLLAKDRQQNIRLTTLTATRQTTTLPICDGPRVLSSNLIPHGSMPMTFFQTSRLQLRFVHQAKAGNGIRQQQQHQGVLQKLTTVGSNRLRFRKQSEKIRLDTRSSYAKTQDGHSDGQMHDSVHISAHNNLHFLRCILTILFARAQYEGVSRMQTSLRRSV